MKKLIALLSEASGLTANALASCVNDDGSLKVEELEKQIPAIRKGIEGKLETARTEATEEAAKATKGKTFEDGRTNGLAEGARKHEKTLREMFGIKDGTLSGDDLMKAISEQKDKPSKAITRDQVEAEQWFRDLLAQKEKDQKEAVKAVKDEFDTYKQTTSKKERMLAMRAKATPIIEALNLNLSPDPQRKATQLERIFQDLEANDYEIKDDLILVHGKDGKVLRDKMENSIPFEQHVTGVATALFDPKESKDRGSAGNKNEQGGQGSGGSKTKWNKELPKNDEEYWKIIADTSIPLDERTALQQAYKPETSTASV